MQFLNNKKTFVYLTKYKECLLLLESEGIRFRGWKWFGESWPDDTDADDILSYKM